MGILKRLRDAVARWECRKHGHEWRRVTVTISRPGCVDTRRTARMCSRCDASAPDLTKWATSQTANVETFSITAETTDE